MEMNKNYNLQNGGVLDGILSPEGSEKGAGGRYSSVICNRTVTAELGGDFNLPEHLPEIRKLIKIDVRPTPSSKFVSGGSVRFSGGIEYVAVYLGADGCVHSASFPGEYAFTVPFDDGCEGGNVTATAQVYPESAVSRVSGASRINIRLRLAAKVLILCERTVSEGAIPSDENIQKLVKKRGYCRELHGIKEDLEIRDEFDTPDNGGVYLTSDCRVFVEEAVSGDGYVDCRGIAIIKHLMCDADGVIRSVNSKLPFSETIEVDGITASSPALVCGMCSDISVNVPETVEGVAGKTEVTARICLDAAAFELCELEYVKDLYSTVCECKTETESYRLPTLLACKNGNMTFSGSDEWAVQGENDIGIADVSGSARAESVEWDGGKYVMSGKCRFDVVYLSENEDGALSAEWELPFRYEFDGTEGEIERYDCAVSVLEPKAKWDGERMSFDCELAVAVCVLGGASVSAVCAVKMGEENDGRRRGFTVCYPDAADSLWSVAKRYKAPLMQTASENGIDADADADEVRLPEGSKYMIV